jgi:opacity protein-like surface antigen
MAGGADTHNHLYGSLTLATLYHYQENEEMSIKKILFIVAVLAVAAFVLSACAGPAGSVGPAGPAGPVGPQGPAGVAPAAADLSCTQCHNNTTLLDGKFFAWEGSRHGTAGIAWEEEAGNQACAGCHEGSSFIDRITAGQSFADYAALKDLTLPDATPQTCRTCHQIHTTYSKDDFALRTVSKVAMVTSGQTFDKGMGNLCVNCHQARRYMPSFAEKDASGAVVAGSYKLTSSRFNPHLSNQSDMMLGVGGGGTVTGSPSAHYSMTTDSCVTCHLGSNNNHTFDATVSACVACHTDAKDTDINGAVTKTQAKYDSLKAGLAKLGLIDDTGAAVVGTYDEAHAFPLWVYGYITEDGSMGVHNPKYANDLLDAAIAGLPAK